MIINRHQSSSMIFNHHQWSSIIINHHQWSCHHHNEVWITVEIVNFSQNCEFQSKLWISVEISNFSTNSEIQLKLWISVEIVNFSRNCEGQSRFNQYLLELDWWEIGKISSRKYSFIKRTNPPSEIGLQPKWGLSGGHVWSSSRETINLWEFFFADIFSWDAEEVNLPNFITVAM